MQMCDVFDQKDYVGIINVSYMSQSTLPPMKPFMQLAETIGAMQGQLSEAKVVSVQIKTWGGRDVNITSKQARQLLESQVLKGLGTGTNQYVLLLILLAAFVDVMFVIYTYHSETPSRRSGS